LIGCVTCVTKERPVWVIFVRNYHSGKWVVNRSLIRYIDHAATRYLPYVLSTHHSFISVG